MSKSAPGAHDPSPETAPASRTTLAPRLLSFAVGLAAIGAIAASTWVYVATQRDIVRMSTDIAQIRLSLELFGRQQPGGGAPAPSLDQRLLDLSNRLAILEDSWRNQPAAALPAIGTGATSAGPTSDCMPAGTRFLVASGDEYPICGTTGIIAVTSVNPGYVVFQDGTTIANGGNAGLKGTACTLAVVSSSADGMDGYAELRVSC
ncbi:hypothetical protein VW29_07005 [Devosia limi DSM 17137]|uniref:Uncharacterized protein n=1 Tax=Devosia limi DSM 17137 TaxID=1121477 RepID=A0A0F5LSD9_9HYPH|nr:hypothetical protein VW29_07005 [Devosia limi DSM 17137]